LETVHTLNFSPAGGRRYRLRLIWSAWQLRWFRFFSWDFDLVLLPRRGPDHYGAELVGRMLAGRGALLVHREERSKANLTLSGKAKLGFYPYSNTVVEHEVLHNLRFLQWCGAANATDSRLELWLTALDRQFAVNALGDRGGYVAIAPGAGHPARCWPIDRFAEIATWIRDRYGLTPVLLGAPGDPEFSEGVNMIGQTSLRQAAAIIERCVLFVGNDSGLMHIASAMGTPVVEISAFRIGGDPNHNNSPARFHPFGVPQCVVQPSVGQKLFAIEEVTVDAVCTACSDLLAARQGLFPMITSPASFLPEPPSAR
jgi:hypothetical protein